MLKRITFFIDGISMWSGKITAWLILAMTFLVAYDVTMRYIQKPFDFGILCSEAGSCLLGPVRVALTDQIRAIWFTYNYSYDMSYYLYAIFFMLGGAYALSRGQHVRGDVFYRLWPVRVQAGIDFTLYIVAFFPGMVALVAVGIQWADASWRIAERSFTSAAAPPIYPLKAVIPLAGALMVMQGVAETIRSYRALRSGVWPARLGDVEETETVLAKQQEI